jgi:hypothetical protein
LFFCKKALPLIPNQTTDTCEALDHDHQRPTLIPNSLFSRRHSRIATAILVHLKEKISLRAHALFHTSRTAPPLRNYLFAGAGDRTWTQAPTLFVSASDGWAWMRVHTISSHSHGDDDLSRHGSVYGLLLTKVGMPLGKPL